MQEENPLRRDDEEVKCRGLTTGAAGGSNRSWATLPVEKGNKVVGITHDGVFDPFGLFASSRHHNRLQLAVAFNGHLAFAYLDINGP